MSNSPQKHKEEKSLKPYEKNKHTYRQRLLTLLLISYLASILLTQTTHTPTSLLLILTPLLLCAVAISINHHKLQLIGLYAFYLLSIPHYLLTTMQDTLTIILILLFFLIPSLTLTARILSQNNPLTIQDLTISKRPLLISTILTAAILLLFYLLTIQLWEGYLLTAEQIEGQIILLAALSITLTAPFFIKQKRTQPTS